MNQRKPTFTLPILELIEECRVWVREPAGKPDFASDQTSPQKEDVIFVECRVLPSVSACWFHRIGKAQRPLHRQTLIESKDSIGFTSKLSVYATGPDIAP